MLENNEVQFKINRIIIAESHLNRAVKIDFKKRINNHLEISINTDKETTGNSFGVELNIKVTGKQEDAEVFNIFVKAIGLFNQEGSSEKLTRKSFQEINAPAIIFPFIREHVSSLSVKAGLGNVILQPINFVAFNKKKRNSVK